MVSEAKQFNGLNIQHLHSHASTEANAGSTALEKTDEDLLTQFVVYKRCLLR